MKPILTLTYRPLPDCYTATPSSKNSLYDFEWSTRKRKNTQFIAMTCLLWQTTSKRTQERGNSNISGDWLTLNNKVPTVAIQCKGRKKS